MFAVTRNTKPYVSAALMTKRINVANERRFNYANGGDTHVSQNNA